LSRDAFNVDAGRLLYGRSLGPRSRLTMRKGAGRKTQASLPRLLQDL